MKRKILLSLMWGFSGVCLLRGVYLVYYNLENGDNLMAFAVVVFYLCGGGLMVALSRDYGRYNPEAEREQFITSLMEP